MEETSPSRHHRAFVLHIIDRPLVKRGDVRAAVWFIFQAGVSLWVDSFDYS